MATRAYLKLLEEKARCTVNFGAGNIFDGSKPMTETERVEFLLARLSKFKVGGYSREYVAQLVKEDLREARKW